MRTCKERKRGDILPKREAGGGLMRIQMEVIRHTCTGRKGSIVHTSPVGVEDDGAGALNAILIPR